MPTMICLIINIPLKIVVARILNHNNLNAYTNIKVYKLNKVIMQLMYRIHHLKQNYCLD